MAREKILVQFPSILIHPDASNCVAIAHREGAGEEIMVEGELTSPTMTFSRVAQYLVDHKDGSGTVGVTFWGNDYAIPVRAIKSAVIKA